MMKVVVAVVVVIIIATFTFWPDAQQPVATDPVAQPAITLDQILSASDLELAARQTAESNQPQALSDALALAAQVATEAGLSQRDIDYLKSGQAKEYLLFKARRQLFFEQFEAHYYALMPIEELKKVYPEAQDLFERAEQLIAQRDQQILQIAEEMADNETQTESYLQLARQQWLEELGRNMTPLQQPSSDTNN
ncbi:hypothetical protein [Aestuariibacter salexigens]|uniref:hypothetical protein n=1 Tax=Aestuariibacter salexigens TaxID=226010 RepID=UPI0004070CE4|nr:hypothetical protein [Aestuariibacter salexigens]